MAAEEALLKWTIGVAVAAFAAVAGHVHVRINRVEDRREGDRADQSARRQKIWDAVNGTREKVSDLAVDLKEHHPTKADLKDTEQRIIHAINGGKG